MTKRLVTNLESGTLCALVGRWRESGATIAFTNGCFDVLHAGHLRILERTRAAAPRMILALNSDAYCRQIKGPQRPIQEQAMRLRVAAGVSEADVALTFGAATPERLLELIRPDVYVLGAEYATRTILGAEFCGRIEFVEQLEGISTTAILERVRSTLAGEAGTNRTEECGNSMLASVTEFDDPRAGSRWW